MHALANAIVDQALFLELSDDAAIDPDAAVRALESIASALAQASPAEIAAVRSVIRQRLAESLNALERKCLATLEDDLGLPPAQ